MDKRGGGEYQDLPSIIFCLTKPKTFAGDPSLFHKRSGIEKIFEEEGVGRIRSFCRNFFV